MRIDWRLYWAMSKINFSLAPAIDDRSLVDKRTAAEIEKSVWKLADINA